jgi:hypothetical protein
MSRKSDIELAWKVYVEQSPHPNQYHGVMVAAEAAYNLGRAAGMVDKRCDEIRLPMAKRLRAKVRRMAGETK